MSDLNDDGLRLLQAARAGYEPSDAERKRVKKGVLLRAAVAIGATTAASKRCGSSTNRSNDSIRANCSRSAQRHESSRSARSVESRRRAPWRENFGASRRNLRLPHEFEPVVSASERFRNETVAGQQ